MSRFVRSIAWGAAAVFALIVCSPALGDDGTLRKGIDAWSTVAGQTHASFTANPIPAGFFCEQAKPFTGTIDLKGVPLATRPAKGLGTIDTVVSRLDDAVFNDKGVATTRIQLTALSLASVKPIETACGSYDVTVTLAGEQPTTTMRIERTEERGGRYQAPLSLNVKMVFSPVQGGARRELVRQIDLGPGTWSVWTYAAKPRYEGPMWIDSDGDGKPDTQVRGDSNFLAGVSPVPAVRLASWSASSAIPTCPPGLCPYQSCHCNPNEDDWDPFEDNDGCAEDHLHCVWVCVDPANIPPGAGPVMCVDTADPPGFPG